MESLRIEIVRKHTHADVCHFRVSLVETVNSFPLRRILFVGVVVVVVIDNEVKSPKLCIIVTAIKLIASLLVWRPWSDSIVHITSDS